MTFEERLGNVADNLNMAATTLRAGPPSAEMIQAVRQALTSSVQQLDDLHYQAKQAERAQTSSGPITDLRLL